MLFNTFLFLAFVPVTALGYRLLYSFGVQARIGFLFATSIIFYAVNDLANLPLLLASIIFNFIIGNHVSQQEDARSKKTWLTFAIIVNIGIIVIYKYLGSIASAAGFFVTVEELILNSALPLGISFFTFTQIAFLMDCYRGQVKKPKLLDYSVFVAWFPHLVAGPLLAHNRILPQLRGPAVRCPGANDYAVGTSFVVLGLFKKLVLADMLAIYTAELLTGIGSGEISGMAAAWTGIFAFMLVVYFDFSGYSDVAIGVSRLFGIDLPINFYSPYRARNPADFWRRWHRTLSWFIRTYVYSNFAGRKSGYKQYLTLIGIMVLVGIWHGSTWNFILFGLYHGILLALYNFWRLGLKNKPNRNPSRLNEILARAATIAVIIPSGGLFYYSDIAQGLLFYQNLIGFNGLQPLFDFRATGFLMIALGFVVIWMLPNSAEFMRAQMPRWTLIQLPRDTAPIKVQWSPSIRIAVFMGILAAISIAAIPGTQDFVYHVF